MVRRFEASVTRHIETKEAIANLVGSLVPVSPLPIPGIRHARWLAIAAAITALSVIAVGIREDIAARLVSVPFRAHVLLQIVAAVSGGAAALTLAIPGEDLRRWRRTAPVVAVAAWTTWLFAEFLLHSDGIAAWPIAITWGCVAKTSAFAAVPGVILGTMIARSAPTNRMTVSAYATLAALAVGALGVELTCPIIEPLHRLLCHAGPIVLAAIGAALSGDFTGLRAK